MAHVRSVMKYDYRVIFQRDGWKQAQHRIFHTHAKDTLVDRAARARVGIYASGWWRYVIPGFGNIPWGEYISHLRMNGYDGVLSIEHEDGAVGREAGFVQGLRHLKQWC